MALELRCLKRKVGVSSMLRVISPLFPKGIVNCYGTTEGRIAVEAIVTPRTRCGFLSLDGSWIIPPTYEDVRLFHEGYAAVKKGGKWGFVDVAGHERVGNRYDDVGDFHEGLAPVKSADTWGVIDLTGTVVAPMQFQELRRFQERSSGGKTKREMGIY